MIFQQLFHLYLILPHYDIIHHYTCGFVLFVQVSPSALTSSIRTNLVQSPPSSGSVPVSQPVTVITSRPPQSPSLQARSAVGVDSGKTLITGEYNIKNCYMDFFLWFLLKLHRIGC